MIDDPITITIIHEKKAEVTLSGSTPVADLFAECRQRWSLPGHVNLRIVKEKEHRLFYVTRSQGRWTLRRAGIGPDAVVFVDYESGRWEPFMPDPNHTPLNADWRESDLPREPWRLTKTHMVFAAFAVLALIGVYAHVARTPVSLQDAVKKGLVEVRATGAGGTGSFSLSISSTSSRMIGLRVVVPSGTSFSSSSLDFQAMAVSHTTVIDVPGAVGVPVQTNIPAYCLNRFLQAPKLESSLKLDEVGGSPPEERNQVRKLISCLETTGAEHQAGQMAVWVVSEGLLQKPAAEVRALFRARIENDMVAEVERKLGSPEAFEALRKQFPDIPVEKLQERVSQTKAQIARMEVQILIDQEVGKYRAQARYPLERCGYNVASAPFFQ